MTTHAHYVTELNNIFGDNWIITDDLACHLLCIKYKIKSEYRCEKILMFSLFDIFIWYSVNTIFFNY